MFILVGCHLFAVSIRAASGAEGRSFSPLGKGPVRTSRCDARHPPASAGLVVVEHVCPSVCRAAEWVGEPVGWGPHRDSGSTGLGLAGSCHLPSASACWAGVRAPGTASLQPQRRSIGVGPAVPSAGGGGRQQGKVSATGTPSKTPPLCTGTWSTTGETNWARRGGPMSSPRSRSPDVQLGSGAAGRGFEPVQARCFHATFFVTQVGHGRVCPAEPPGAPRPSRVGALCSACPPPGGAGTPSPFAGRLWASLLLL